MEIQKLYDEFIDISTELYQNGIEGLVHFSDKAEDLQYILEEIVVKLPQYMTALLDCASKIRDAVENNDKLLLADVIYNDLCNIIKEYAKNIQSKEIEYQRLNLELNEQCRDMYEKNQEVLLKSEVNDKELISMACEDFDIDDDEIAADSYGNLMVCHKNRWWRLNSFYNRENAVAKALQPLRSAGYIRLLFIYGIGNGDYLKSILKMIPTDTIVMVYEPEKKIFGMNMHYNDLSIVFNRKKTFLFIEGINSEKMEPYLFSVFDKTAAEYMYTFVSPGYDVIYAERLEDKACSCRKIMDNAYAQDYTIQIKSDILNYDRIMNFRLLFDSIFLTDLKKVISEKVDVKNVPAIVVAAGPSLDKNIHLLKKAEGKAFILVVDSAVRMLLEHDITPDGIVTIDPYKQKVLFENKLMRERPIFYCLHSTYDNIKDLKGRKIFCSGTPGDEKLFKIFGREEQSVSGGGCVSNTAISIAETLGFENIITVGLDLAFTEKKIHASVVYNDGGIVKEEEKFYTQVKSQSGEMLLTYKNFVIYKNWIENNIRENGGKITIINATEGGVYIEGAVHMTLEEALLKYCRKNVNISECIMECPNYCEKNDIGNADKYLEQFVKECDTAYQSFEKCYQLYHDMLECNSIDMIKQSLKQIGELNEELNELFVIDIITDYASSEVNQYVNQMYDNTTADSTWEDIRRIAENGMEVYNLYMKCAKKTQELIKKT